MKILRFLGGAVASSIIAALLVLAGIHHMANQIRAQREPAAAPADPLGGSESSATEDCTEPFSRSKLTGACVVTLHLSGPNLNCHPLSKTTDDFVLTCGYFPDSKGFDQ